MRRHTLALIALLSTPSLAGVEIQQPVWYVELSCKGYSQCYAASNGSYTGSFTGARKFNDPSQATRFLNSLTSSLRSKSPQLQQGFTPVCIEGQPASTANAKRC
ncbi:hypothetical protein [Atopomonas sediminilitoris]|uniref:hypothetical protein n=1 Tax=Atopomonas sediminilitoris TaxID=2919919 RepID=UPI001F4D9BE2|nr:hypothetical protein [Atopomonas sediminilitoris]MCJ8168493.1 hypothetical protein [Atopomonas sediminilitoris]